MNLDWEADQEELTTREPEMNGRMTYKDRETLDRLIAAYGVSDVLETVADYCKEQMQDAIINNAGEYAIGRWAQAAQNVRLCAEFAFRKWLRIRL